MPRRPAIQVRRSAPREREARRPWANGWSIAVGGLALAAIAAAVAGWTMTRRERLATQAVRAGEAGDWAASARLWGQINDRPDAAGESLRSEARAALAAGRAAQAERALRRAVQTEPVVVEPWLLLLELLRLEDRPLEALRIGWAGYAAVPVENRSDVLRALTLALLADAPDDLARATLSGWVAADPEDLDARLALLRRQAASPRDGDPARADRIKTLSGWLAEHPDHAGVREALVLDLADAGEVQLGRAALDGWPEAARDARYFRLLGRWQLDYEGRPAEAIAAFRRVLDDLPHDWRTRYRLARALEAAGHRDEARAESVAVAALREALDPARLGARLDNGLAKLDTPEARLNLAGLCRRVGLSRLADAWRDVEVPAGR